MPCLKCKGLMVPDGMPGLVSEALVWRCINCGLMMDPVIRQNQEAMACGLPWSNEGRRPIRRVPVDVGALARP